MDPVIKVYLVIYSNESLFYMPSRNITEGKIAMAQSLVPYPFCIYTIWQICPKSILKGTPSFWTENFILKVVLVLHILLF